MLQAFKARHCAAMQSQIAYFHTSTSLNGKAAKRRKMNRIEKSPNLSFNISSRKKTPIDYALAHFDDVFQKSFGEEWHSIRLALLSKPKFCAVVNNLSDKENVIKELTSIGCYSMRENYESEVMAILKTANPTIVEEKTELPESKPVARPKKVENDDLETKDIYESMNLEAAKGRVVDPESIVIGGNFGKSMKQISRSSEMFMHVPPTTLRGMEDFVEELDYYQTYEKVVGIPVEIVKEPLIPWPEMLEVMTFPTGNVEHFQQPRRMVDGGNFNYYCLNASSILPVVLLNIKKGNSVLDMCAGPGGKSLVAMQTLNPGLLLCNDKEHSRVKRILNVMDAYLKDLNTDVGFDLIQIKKSSGEILHKTYPNQFDRVLCDVPCYTDRCSVLQTDGNIFHPNRAREKLLITQTQTELLASGLQCLKPGGSLIYSTCTMSAVQNDGVVYNALKTLWEETSFEFTISDLSEAIGPFRSMMKFANKNAGLKYGQLVLPNLLNNFGPMYIAKINRKS